MNSRQIKLATQLGIPNAPARTKNFTASNRKATKGNNGCKGKVVVQKPICNEVQEVEDELV